MEALHNTPAYRLHRLQRRLRAHLLGLLAEVRISPEQYFVLMRLDVTGGLAQGELGDEALDDRASVSRQVASLERLGLVERGPHPEDRRAVLVRLSPEGRRLVEAFTPRVQEERSRLFGGLPAADLAALHRVIDHLEARLPAGG